MWHLFMSLFALAFLAGSALAQSTTLNYPTAGSTLKTGSKITVQVGMGGYPENINNVALVIGFMPCYGGSCSPPSSFLGTILYQGNYKPFPGTYFANYTVTVPSGYTGPASLNVANFFMVGASYEPIIDYLNVDVTIVS